MIRKLSAAVAVLMFVTVAFVTAQPAAKHDQGPAPNPAWITAPDRHDFAAEVRVLKPLLTFQRRYLVEARVGVDGAVAHGRRFTGWLIVGDKTGHSEWEPMFDKDVSTESLDKHSELQLVLGFYAVPADYTITLALKDTDSGQIFLSHHDVKVERAKNDPPPNPPEGPHVEFVHPPDQVSRLRYLSQDKTAESEIFWPLSSHREPLDINTTAPLTLDLVLDLSNNQPEPSSIDRKLPLPPLSTGLYTTTAMGAALTDLSAPNLCMRISAIDIAGMRPVFWRARPDAINWQQVRKKSLEDMNTVAVSALLDRKKQPAFVRDFIQKLDNQVEGCNKDARHVVVIVSNGFSYPWGAPKPPIAAEALGATRFFYIRNGKPLVVFTDDRQGRRSLSLLRGTDELPDSLRGLDLHKFDVLTPSDFSKALGRIAADLSKK